MLGQDYAIKNMDLSDYGRKEVEIAETEMPGLSKDKMKLYL